MTKPPASTEDQRRVATAVVRRLREAGHEGWFVGGCVREMLLGHEPADFDVTTDAVPDRIAELFPHVVPLGRQFGVMTVVEEGVHVEVATYRTEGGYADGRRPRHVRFASAEEDVARRDFTINALLYDPLAERVVDHVGGREDLAAGLVRTVGDPATRFEEDHLRLLRAVRFAARLGFRLDEATDVEVRRLAPRITRISPERIRDELTRMVAHRSRAVALRLLDETGLLREVLPEIDALHGVTQPSDYHPEGDVFVHVVLAMEALPPDASAVVAWAVLLHDIGKPDTRDESTGRIRFLGHDVLGERMAQDLLRRLRFSNDDRERIAWLVRHHLRPRDAPHMRRAKLRRLLAEPWLSDLMAVCRADALGGSGDLTHLELLEEARARGEGDLPGAWVTGRDLHERGVPQGPEFGRLLGTLRDEQLDGRLASREAALARLDDLLGGSPPQD